MKLDGRTRTWTAMWTKKACFRFPLEKKPKLFVCSLFNEAFSVTQDYIASNEGEINEWWVGRELEGSGCGLIFRYYPSICLEGLRQTTRNFSPRFQPGIFRIWSTSVNHPTTTLGNNATSKTKCSVVRGKCTFFLCRCFRNVNFIVAVRTGNLVLGRYVSIANEA
jgi:hypothetical protein